MKSILRKTHQRFIVWGLFDLVASLIAIAGLSLLIAAGLKVLNTPPAAQQLAMYVWWVVCFLLVCWRFCSFGVALLNSKGVLEKLERTHPEYRNELSTLTYLDTHREEVNNLGFSPSLIQALRKEVDELPAPDWVRLGLSPSTRKWLLGFAAIGAVSLIGFYSLVPGFADRLVRAHLYGESEILEGKGIAISLPERVEVPFRHELIVSPSVTDPYLNIDFGETDRPETIDLLARSDDTEWRSVGTLGLGEGATSDPISIRIDRTTRLCFSTSQGMSAICEVIPVYPPAVEQIHVTVAEPDYTGNAPFSIADVERVEAFESSNLVIRWGVNSPVVAATLEVLSPTRSVTNRLTLAPDPNGDLSHTQTLTENAELRVAMTDRFGQHGLSKNLRLISVADSSPTLEILSPTREVTLPPDLRLSVRMTARDDIGLSSVTLVYRVDNGMPSGGDYHRTVLADHLAGMVGGATPFIGETVLDLGDLDLWPGDQVVYWFEATDYRGDGPSGKGVSPNFFVRYPTVEENMDDMAAVRKESVDGIQELLEEQKQINRQFEEIRKDIQRNRGNLSDPDVKFDAQKKLADTLQREQELQEKLAEAGEKFDETLKRLSENDNQALRTLHKFQRVQELMDELMTEESKKILQELQETLQQLRKDELQPDDLEKTEENLEDFEKQLDRQLALLENLWLEQEVEALRDQAEELAQRQDELKEATKDQLSEEDKAEVEQDEADRENGIEDSQENMDERLDKMIDQLEEKIAEKEESKSSEKQSEQQSESTESPESQESSSKEESSQEETPSSEQEQNSNESEDSESQSNSEEQEEQIASSQDPSKGEESETSEEEKGLTEKEQSQKQEQMTEGSQPEQASDPSDSQPPQEEKPNALAERQEQLNEETERLLEELKRLTEKANEKEHQLADRLNQMDQGEMCDSIQGNQQSAQSQLEQNQMKQAAKSQSKAGEQMQQLAQSLGECCSGSGPDMQEIVAKMREILDRAFLLSGEGEETDRSLARYKGLSDWPNVDRMSRMGTEMGWYRQESSRLSTEFSDVAKENPFADFEVVKKFDRASDQWKRNTQVMEEDSPIAVSMRSHQALASVNQAIEKLIESLDETNSQSQSSSGLEGYFKGIKKLLSQQKGINEQTQKLKEQMGQKPGQRMPGQPQGEGLSPQEQLEKIAQQQAATRRQLQALEEQYRDAKERTGTLEGVGDQMQNVERELQQGLVNDRVTDMQENIMQRLLDAEKSIHNQGYKKKRRALRTDGVLVEESPSTLPDLLESENEEDLARLLRKDLDQVSPHWRDRVRK